MRKEIPAVVFNDGDVGVGESLYYYLKPYLAHLFPLSLFCRITWALRIRRDNPTNLFLDTEAEIERAGWKNPGSCILGLMTRGQTGWQVWYPTMDEGGAGYARRVVKMLRQAGYQASLFNECPELRRAQNGEG